jgi:hypothetical protein
VGSFSETFWKYVRLFMTYEVVMGCLVFPLALWYGASWKDAFKIAAVVPVIPLLVVLGVCLLPIIWIVETLWTGPFSSLTAFATGFALLFAASIGASAILEKAGSRSRLQQKRTDQVIGTILVALMLYIATGGVTLWKKATTEGFSSESSSSRSTGCDYCSSPPPSSDSYSGGR